MELQEQINKLLQELNLKLGTKLSKLDRNGVCAMRYMDKFDFIMEAPKGGDHLYFYSPLVSHQGDNEALHTLLLQSNYRFEKTGGATYALDKQNGDLVLCRVISMEALKNSRFQDVINQFLTTAEKCQKELHCFSQQADTHLDQDGPANSKPSAPHGFISMA